MDEDFEAGGRRRAAFFASPEFWRAADAPRRLPRGGAPQVAFAGRSNSGKSSAINALCARRIARAARTPGRTRAVCYFNLRGGRGALVDLPGYGYAAVSRAQQRGWAALASAALRRPQLRGAVVAVDCRRGWGEADQLLLQHIPENMPLLALLTKADKLTARARRAALDGAQKTLAGISQPAGVILFSAKNQTGVDAARAAIIGWLVDS